MVPTGPNIDNAFAMNILEHSLNPVVVIDLDSSIKYVNPAFLELTGFARNDIEGHKAPFPYWPRDYQHQYSQDHLTDSPFRGERLFQKKNGEEFWIEVSSNPVREDGRILFHLVDWVDITSRKRASEALRATEAFNTSLLENAPNPILVGSADYRLTYVNRAFERLTGYTSGEILGKTPPFPWSLDETMDFVIDPASGDEICSQELCHKKKSGDIFWIAANIKRVWENGKPAYVLANWVDITERKQAEEAARKSEEKYRSLVNNVKLGISRSTPGAGGRFLEVNRAMETITGYSREELLTMSVKDLYLHPEERPLITGQAAASSKSSSEVWFKRKDGSAMMAAVTLAPVKDGAGNVDYFDGILEDISERKRLEAERSDVEQKAQIANRLASVGEMAAGIAHEINNPLTSIIGYTDLLMRKDLAPETKQTLEIVCTAAHRVADIVQRLLFFARQSKPMRDFVSLNQLVENTLQLRAHQLSLNNVEVITRLDPGLPQIMADGGQMQQVFLNIIANAETEMSLANGKGHLWITSQRAPQAIQISFKDDGPGIAPENMQKLFQPFFTTRAVGKGTGLGLSVCHGIVTEHKGRIWAESQPDSGATFFVELPLTHRP